MRPLGLCGHDGTLAVLITDKLNIEDEITTLWSESAAPCVYAFVDALGF